MGKRYASVWDALIEEPGERESYKIKSKLMMSIEKYIKDNELTQEKAAELMGVSQPKVSNIVNGKIDKISIDLLIKMLVRIDIDIDLSINKPQTTVYEFKEVTREAETTPAIFIISDDSTATAEVLEIHTPYIPKLHPAIQKPSDQKWVQV